MCAHTCDSGRVSVWRASQANVVVEVKVRVRVRVQVQVQVQVGLKPNSNAFRKRQRGGEEVRR